jgi:aspartate/methionine/tyrosine aminotransferase
MVINLSITMPDDSTADQIAQYLREQADNASNHLEYEVIKVPSIDESILIDYRQVDFKVTHEAQLFRSE